MKNQFWAGLGSRAVLVKKFGADYQQLLRAFFFMFSGAKKIENIIASALKSCIEKKVKKKFFSCFVLFYRPKFECNLSVST